MKNAMTGKTFAELYEAEKSKPTAAQAFIDEVAKVTKRAKPTIRQWIMGLTTPDDLVKQTLSQHFGIPADKLFPARNH